MSLPLQAINPDTGKARVAIYLQDAHRIREGMEFTQYAESKGFEAVWQAESRLVREATVPMRPLLQLPAPSKWGLVWWIAGVVTLRDLPQHFLPLMT